MIVGYWIGLSDRETEGEWKWQQSGVVTTWTNWDGAEPGGGVNEGCVAVETYSMKWHDYGCDEVVPYIYPLCSHP